MSENLAFANTGNVNCLHCGLPIAENRKDPDYRSTDFCCNGCELVYQIINNNGFGSFYKLRATDTLAPVNSTNFNYDYFDDELFSNRYIVTNENNNSSLTLYIERIHCAACVWLLEKMPEYIKGVSNITANISESTIKLTFDPKLNKLSTIATEIAKFGYRPVEFSDYALKESKKRYERDFLLRMGVAGFCAGNTMLLAISLYQADYTGIEKQYEELLQFVSAGFAFPAVLYSAWPFYRSAWSSLRLGKLHIDTPISIGILVGFIGGLISLFADGQSIYFDSICILIFLLLAGRWIQYRMLEKSKDKIKASTFLPNYAKRKAETETEFENVLLERLNIGDLVIVNKNEVVPVDGIIKSEFAYVDNAHITGESRAIKLNLNQNIFAGSLCKSDNILIETTAIKDNTRIGKVLRTVAENMSSKQLYEDITTRLSGWFTIIVIIVSIATLVFNWHLGADQALSRMIALLVITCPCALGLSAPLAASVAVSKAMKEGVLIRNSQVFEKLSLVRTAFFDKTGTITKGDGKVVNLYKNIEKITDFSSVRELLSLVYNLEQNIEHPLAVVLRNFCNEKNANNIFQSAKINKIEVIPGCGVKGQDDSRKTIVIGKPEWTLKDIECSDDIRNHIKNLQYEAFTVVTTYYNNDIYIFTIRDELVPEVEEVLSYFNKNQIRNHIISGDNQQVVKALTQQFANLLDSAEGDLTPEDKARIILENKKNNYNLMVGDGINDISALSSANIGIAIRGGVEACLGVAEVFIGSGKIKSLVDLLEAGKQTRRVIKRNIIISLFYNIIGAYGAYVGLVNPLVAAILMPLSSISIIYSSFRNRVFENNRILN
jgi:Cu2+-exporting ATPase